LFFLLSHYNVHRSEERFPSSAALRSGATSRPPSPWNPSLVLSFMPLQRPSL
jgi:hypothetical protein